MDAFNNIVGNVPHWQQRLEELSGQISHRQVELAAVGRADTPAKSIRNRGSTESLLRKDDEPSTPPEPTTPTPKAAQLSSPVEPAPAQTSSEPPSPQGPSSAAIQKQTQQAMAVAQARARAQVRRRHRSQSIVSIEGNPSAYRSRSMIIVYYDSYVQEFFEELVKFISASRNLLRKAKMAAKVAAIKRLAEMDTPEDEDEDDDIGMPTRLTSLHSARLITSRAGNLASLGRVGALGALGGRGSAGKDKFDEIDKGLEIVQSTCERAAHQFLRDGDCSDEIETIRKRLGETKDLTEKEMERIQREEPELAQETTGELRKARTHRPATMRRDAPAGKGATPELLPASPSASLPAVQKLDMPQADDTASPKMGVDKIEADVIEVDDDADQTPDAGKIEVDVIEVDMEADNEAVDISALLPRSRYRTRHAATPRALVAETSKIAVDDNATSTDAAPIADATASRMDTNKA